MKEILHANTLLIPLPKKRARSLEKRARLSIIQDASHQKVHRVLHSYSRPYG